MMTGSELARIRADFPLLQRRDVIYLDNAATSQKPRQVLDVWRTFYEKSNANPYRGLYTLAEEATALHEDARAVMAAFIHASAPEEIIFVRNATEGLNLLAYSLEGRLRAGDEILISIMEHHSNLIPWQQLSRRTGAVLTYVDCLPDGTLTPQMVADAVTPRTKLVCMTHVSNVLGWCNDLQAMAKIAHDAGALFIADGAQSVPHMPVDVTALDVDFMAFSGHKMLAPMGIGCLYGKRSLLDELPPFLFGGEMIDSVSRQEAVFAEVPHKFEAGTVNAAGAVALAEAARYLTGIGFDAIQAQEDALTAYAMTQMRCLEGVRILGSSDPAQHHGIITFCVEGVHPHDVSEILSCDQIAVRAGHHCAQPLLQHLGFNSATRVSLAFYNSKEEIDAFIRSLSEVRRQMGYV